MSNVYGQTLLDDMVKRQGLPMPLVKQAANEILDLIREGLARDGVVSVSHFGTFRLKAVAARQGVNPQTREPITIPAHQRVIFSPCKALRELIQPEHPPVIPIDAERGTERTAARSAPIVPVASIRINPQPPATKEQRETTPQSATSRVVPAEVQPPTAVIAPDSDTLSTKGDGSATEIPATTVKASPVGTAAESDTEGQQSPSVDEQIAALRAIELEREFARNSKRRSYRKGYLLGAAALMVMAIIAVSLLRNETDHVEPMTPPSAAKPEPAPAAVTRVTPPQPEAVTEQPAVQAVTEPPQAAATHAEEPDPATVITSSSDDTVPLTDTPDLTAEGTSTASAEPAPQPGADAQFFFSEQSYTMSHGESLWRLARRFYHAPLLWPHIYQANAAIISNPDNLLTGQQIIIPTLQGKPGQLTRTDRRNIAEGYYLTYLHYKKVGHKDAFFALLEAKRYDNKVVEEHRSLGHIRLSKVEEILLGQQETMPF